MISYVMDKDIVNSILEALFWLATAWLTIFMLLTIFSLSFISMQMNVYKLMEIAKLPFIGCSVYLVVWLARGLISKKWWY